MVNFHLPQTVYSEKQLTIIYFLILSPRKSFFNLTIDLLSLGIYAPGPQVLTQLLRGVRI